MCSTDPNLPKQSKTAHCACIAAFIFSIFSMIGFGAGITGIIGAVCGILACVACSIIMCCGPKPGQGGGKYMAAFVLLLIGGLVQIGIAVWIIISLVQAANYVSSTVNDLCSACDTDSYGNNCKDGSYYGYTGGECLDSGADTTTCDWGDSCGVVDTHTTAAIGILSIIMGIAAGMQLAAGILNLIAGVFCFKAKGAMEQMDKPGA